MGEIKSYKITVAVLIILLCVAAGFMLKYARLVIRDEIKNGIYMTVFESAKTPYEAQYIMFKDGQWFRYNYNRELTSKGKAELNSDGVYVLTMENSGGQAHAMYSKGFLYLFDVEKNQVLKMYQIDTRTYFLTT